MNNSKDTLAKLQDPRGFYGDQVMSVGWMRRFSYMERMFSLISSVQGDIVECGVGKGHTFSILAYLTGRESSGRTLRGYDSFEGFPEPSVHDLNWRNPQAGEWPFESEVTKKLLEESGVLKKFPELTVRLVKGFFGETLPKESGYKIALLHADGDLYESYKDILNNLWDSVSSGGVVLFDEYLDCQPNPNSGEIEDKWPGATKAIDEFFEPMNLKPVLDEETGKFYIFKP